MKQVSSSHTKNIALLGHGGSGKTTLTDAMLAAGGAIARVGKVAEGGCVTDFDPEEKKRGASISTAIAPLIYKDYKLNLIDAPGLFDFAGGVREALAAADSALIVPLGQVRPDGGRRAGVQ